MQTDIVPRREAVKNRIVDNPALKQAEAGPPEPLGEPHQPSQGSPGEETIKNPPAEDNIPESTPEAQETAPAKINGESAADLENQPSEEPADKSNSADKPVAAISIAVAIFIVLASAAIYREVSGTEQTQPSAPYQATGNFSN